MFTNSALWTLIVLGTIWLFMFGGMKRELIPGRWQVAVEGLIGFVDDMVNVSIGRKARNILPWVFTAFVFLLFANLMGNMPFGVVPGRAPVHRHQPVHLHRRDVADQLRDRARRRLLEARAALLLAVRAARTRRSIFKFVIAPIEFVSFLVRPFSLGLRPFIAMFAGHILLDVFGNFVVQGLNAGAGGIGISILCFLFIMFISALELLVAAIQAYVFAILTSLYINDAVNLH